MADFTQQASATVTAPTAGATIVSLASGVLPAGRYRVRTKAGISGNAVADLGNMRLNRGAGTLVSVLPHGASGQMEDFEVEVDLDGTQALTIIAIGAGTAAIEYTAALAAERIGSL